MQKRVSHGTEAAPQIARELLSGEHGDRLQDPVVGPAVVFVEQLNVIFSHGGGRWPTLLLGNLTLPRVFCKTGDEGIFWLLAIVPSDGQSAPYCPFAPTLVATPPRTAGFGNRQRLEINGKIGLHRAAG